MTATFAQLGLHSNLEAALVKAGLTVPTPVQQKAIPSVLEGRDVMACAQTGTGKTAAFVLPGLHRILSNASAVTGRGPRLLILTPTRELAQQVQKNVQQFGAGSYFKTAVIVGGVAYGPQFSMLQGNLDVMVATPGRLIDHLQEKRIDFSRVEMVVLDEADRMLDMGFLKPVMQILGAIQASAPRPQILLFSATFNDSVDKFAKSVLQAPVRVELAPARTENLQIEQQAFRSDGGQHKQDLLKATLETIGGQAIIFAATKHGSEKLAKTLSVWGYQSAALHGGMRQNVRTRTLKQMHENKIQFLVATDVAARGIDVKLLSHVINYDLPQVAEDYVHRIGRTGRAGDTGIAISLVAPTDYPMLKEIEKLIGKPIALKVFDGHAPSLDVTEFERQGRAAPKSRGGNSRGGPRAGSAGPRREGSSFGGPRKSFGERSERSSTGYAGKPAGERKPFGDRAERSERPYNPERKSFSSDRPRTERAEGGERKSWGAKPTGERSGYAGKPAGERSSGGYAGKPSGERSSGGYKGTNPSGGYKGKSSFGERSSSAPRGEGRSEGRSDSRGASTGARPARIGGGGFKGKAAAGAPRTR